jgi:hypothetical protein
VSADREISGLLGELGFSDPGAQEAARQALEQAGLTRPGKSRISEGKLERVRSLLAAGFARACADKACRDALARAKPQAKLLLVKEARDCERCGGSDNLKAMRRLADLCRPRHIARVVVVGGSPSVRAELVSLKPAEWELRLVDGTERRTPDKARADLEWAQLVFVWGSSELDHKVSKLYTDTASPHRHKRVQVARRGVAALLNAGSEHVERHG